VPGEILVGFEGEVAALFGTKGAAVALEAAGKLVGAHGLHNPSVLMGISPAEGKAARLLTHWQLPAGADVLQTVQQLAGQPGIAYAEPNYVLSIAATPNDPRFGELWGLHNTGQSGGKADADIDAPEAWDLSTGSSTVVVGVIDTGVDYTHPDLAANIWTNPGETPGDGIDNDGNGFVDDYYGWDFYNNDNDPFDDNGHGTHVAGTIGAVGNNGTGVVGVNWNVQIMPIKFLGAGGSGSTSAAVQAVNYATLMRNRGVNVVLTNNSWGGGSFSQALYDAIAASGQANMLFVAAAGNANSNSPMYPAGYDLPNIISVAATDQSDAKASFSNYGADWVDLGAPGVGILSTTPSNTYSVKDGTSMAAPHVSGVAALAWSMNPQATYETIRDAIFTGVDKIPALDAAQGSTTPVATGGRLNAYNTLGRLGMTVQGSSPAAGDIVTTPPVDFVIDFSLPVDWFTLQPADLTVNGVAANSVTLVDADTARFSFQSSPVTNQGLQTMQMAAGSVTSTTGLLLSEWNATFRYDVTRMQVISTSPVSGARLEAPSGIATLVVDFNEPYDPKSVQPADLALSHGSVTDVRMVDEDTLEYTLSGLFTAPLSVRIAAGWLTDPFGNPIQAFTATYLVDTLSPPGVQEDAPWPISGQNSQRTGRSPYSDGPQTGNLKWVSLDYHALTPTIGKDGTLYGAGYGYLTAINPVDRSTKWKVWIGDSAQPTIDNDGILYVGGKISNTLYAVSPFGKILWSYNAGAQLGSVALATDGSIVVGAANGQVYALDRYGAVRWTYQTGDEIEADPAIAPDGTIYVGSRDKFLYALNSNGSLKWRAQTSDHVHGLALGPDGTIYVFSADFKLWAFTPQGNRLWNVSMGKADVWTWTWYTPAIYSDASGSTTIYAGGPSKLYAVRSDGSVKWTFNTGSPVRSLTAGKDGTLFAEVMADDRTDFFAIDPSGKLRWSDELGGSGAGAAIDRDGTLYVGGTWLKAYWDGPATPYAPRISYIRAFPEPVSPGGTLTLTARQVSDFGASTQVVRVDFYRDTNGNGTLDVDTDLLVGTDTNAGDGWSVSLKLPSNLPPGTYTYFARATNSEGLASNVVSTTSTVTKKVKGASAAAAGPAANADSKTELLASFASASRSAAQADPVAVAAALYDPVVWRASAVDEFFAELGRPSKKNNQDLDLADLDLLFGK